MSRNLINNFDIKEGISKKQISDLISYSNKDTLIQYTTSDNTRFKDRIAFNRWLEKGRDVYVMSDKKEKLFGIIWFGKKPIPKDANFTKVFNKDLYSVTFAIRIYENARGKGLSIPFMKAAFRKHNNPKYVWLKTDEKNQIAIRVYEKFGFEKVSTADENGRIIMILP